MPNPFDLRGPEFLVFYAVLGACVVAAVSSLRRRQEGDVAVSGPLVDYLKIAYLRGGAEEAVRVAAVALIDRGLLGRVGDDRLKAVGPNPPAGLNRTETRLLETCRAETRASEIISDESLKVTVRTECEGTLIRAGLLPDERIRAARIRLVLIGVLVLGSVAMTKILVAFSRGRANVLFLIVACVGFAVVVYRNGNPVRTQAGDAMLADLRELFRALRHRAASITIPTGGNDLALLAAVFGTAALPADASFVRTLFRKPNETSGCGAASSCGSSCGGGCGGGCGGCGS